MNKTLRISLLPLSLIYWLAIQIRNLLYDLGILSQEKLDCRVISIGNISTGGTGKTPATVYIAQLLQSKNISVGILSRGYGRTTKGTLTVSDGKKILTSWREAGDEPLMMARQLPGIPIVVDEDRVRGGKFLMAQFDVNTIILDDGFQHRRLARDIDIVLLSDQTSGTGLHKLLPAGNYREPFSSIRRASAIVFSKSNIVFPSDDHVALAKRSGLPLFRLQMVSALKNTVSFDLPYILKEEMALKVVLVAGIGNPEAFTSIVRESGINVVGRRFFRDHYSYTSEDLSELSALLKASAADLILTTEKDYVRLDGVNSDMPIRVYPVRAESENRDDLLKLLLS